MSDFIPQLQVNGPLVNGPISILNNGTALKTRPRINFVSGPAFGITATDDTVNYKTDITLGGTAPGYYGCFYDLTNQTAASTTAAYVFTYNTTDGHNGVTLASGSRITVANAGTYNLQFSIQFNNTDTQAHDADVWIRVNGTDYRDSNSIFGIPSTHGGADGHTIAVCNFYLLLAANDYVELAWHVDDTHVSAHYTAAGTSPTRPATPSVIVTIGQIANF